MRKILSVLLLLSLLTGVSSADTLKVGILSKLNMTEEEYSGFIAEGRKAGAWSFFSSRPAVGEIVFKFYDTIHSLQLGLNAGEIDEAALPEDVAEYVINATGAYKVSSIVKTRPAYFSFGFKEGSDPKLLNQFNEAILSMKEDGTLSVLQAKYIYEAGIGDPEAIEFRNFDNVERTITIAVTGDLPPIDYVDAEGSAAGFNTAVVAEIGRRLKANVKIIDVEAGARASAVASGRADAVFWIQGYRDVKKQSDVPEGLVLSEPYYEWNEYLFIAPVKR